MMHDMMRPGHGMQGSWWGAWPILGTLWILLSLTFGVLILTGLAFAVRWLWRETSQRTMQAPLELLKARYARGELSRHEFEAMRQDLERR